MRRERDETNTIILIEKGEGVRRERDETNTIILIEKGEGVRRERDICYTLNNFMQVHLPFQHTLF